MRFAIEVALLCWPAAAINHAPIIYPDTQAYFHGGQAIWDRIRAMFEHHESLANSTTEGARVVRSVFYSAFVYFPSVLISPWAVIVLQAVIVVVSLRLLLTACSPAYDGWRTTVFIAVIAAVTTAAWCVSLMLPDVFGGTLLLGFMTAAVFWSRLNALRRAVLLLIVLFSVLMHLSNLPVIFGLLICGPLLRIRFMRRDWPAFAALGLVAVAAVCLILTSSVIGFKQWSLSPNGPPYLLARSIEDGPGRLYLLEHCPQINLAMCHHLDRLDLSTDDFLWHDNGVYKLVSREEAAQLRAEGNRVFVQAAFEHPWMQLKAFVVNATYQLGYFTLGDFRIPSYPVLQHGEMTLYPWSPDDVGGDAPPEVAPWKLPANVAVYGVVIISVVACCAFWVRGQLSRDLRDLFLLVLGAVLINAMAVVASTATPRYEARLIWLLPVVALIALWRSRLTGNVQRSTSPSG